MKSEEQLTAEKKLYQLTNILLYRLSRHENVDQYQQMLEEIAKELQNITQ